MTGPYSLVVSRRRPPLLHLRGFQLVFGKPIEVKKTSWTASKLRVLILQVYDGKI